MQSILMKAAGHSSKMPLMILTGMSLTSESRTRASRTLPSARIWDLCKSAFRAIFGEKAAIAVAIVLIAAMWWHIVSIDDAVAMGEAIATDCLYALPWGIACAMRSTLSKKGGRL